MMITGDPAHDYSVYADRMRREHWRLTDEGLRTCAGCCEYFPGDGLWEIDGARMCGPCAGRAANEGQPQDGYSVRLAEDGWMLCHGEDAETVIFSGIEDLDAARWIMQMAAAKEKEQA
jgi:hypothetical protein